MKKLLFIGLISVSFCKGQTNCVFFEAPEFNQDGAAGNVPKEGRFWGNSFNYAVHEFSGVMWANVKDKRYLAQKEQERAQAMAKLNIIRNQYSEIDSFPIRIIDGWHSVVATDNVNYCKDAKVLVENNKIKKFYVDNCISINFAPVKEVKKCKTAITLQNYNGEQLNILDVYFIYDMEGQNISEPPIKPGAVCFWSNNFSPENIYLKLNNVPLDNMSETYNKEPEPFAKGTVTRILKPGTYTYFGDKRHGSGRWEGTIEIKSGECCMIKL